MGYILLLSSGAISIVGAVISLLFSKLEDAAKIIGCIFGMVATGAAMVCGFAAIFDQPQLVSIPSWFDFAPFSIRLNPLDGLLLLVINTLGLMVSSTVFPTSTTTKVRASAP